MARRLQTEEKPRELRPTMRSPPNRRWVSALAIPIFMTLLLVFRSNRILMRRQLWNALSSGCSGAAPMHINPVHLNRSRLHPGMTYRRCEIPGVIAICIDDGHDSLFEPTLDALKRESIPATFFSSRKYALLHATKNRVGSPSSKRGPLDPAPHVGSFAHGQCIPLRRPLSVR